MLERFGAAAADGFRAVEFAFAYEHPRAELAARLHAHGLQQVLINAPRATWPAATAAWPACRRAATRSAVPCSTRRCPTPRRWAAPRCTSWPA